MISRPRAHLHPLHPLATPSSCTSGTASPRHDTTWLGATCHLAKITRAPSKMLGGANRYEHKEKQLAWWPHSIYLLDVECF